MLTVIYVYEPATLTIEARDPRDERATLRRFDKRLPPREIRELGTVPLECGVYAILSRGTLRIGWSSGRVETSTLTKDEWPDPPSLEAGASQEQVRAFFGELEKGGDV
jgi:hypothetical protein